jgi:hypothetical protein
MLSGECVVELPRKRHFLHLKARPDPRHIVLSPFCEAIDWARDLSERCRKDASFMSVLSPVADARRKKESCIRTVTG